MESTLVVESIRLIGGLIAGLLALVLALGSFIGARVISKQDALSEKVGTQMEGVRADMNAMGTEIRKEILASAEKAHVRIAAVEGEVNFIKGKLDTNPGFMVKAP